MTGESGIADDYGTFVARLDPALAIVTLYHDGERSGCLVGFHSSCSIDPPLHAVWLSQANHTYELALVSELLAVHLVDAGAHDLAEHFGGLTGDETDKFAGIAWHPGPDDVPLLDELPNRFVGRRVRVLDASGDHICMVVEPVAVDLGEAANPKNLHLSDATDVDSGHDADDQRS
ncbi:MAG TPA: flavin reductase family protein [Acidimicrobiales bacterium]|nr:flavin reductase family protein [Acidimicrobiales bacterium]